MPAWSRVVLPLVLAAFFLHHLGAMPLQEPDEGRYGDIASTMLRTGDWITPRLDGIRYYEKPPLFFWLAASSVRLLGPEPSAFRLPSALASLLTALLILAWGRRVLGPRAGALAAIALATMPLEAMLARLALVDLTLTLFTTLAIVAADRALFEPAPGEPSRRGWILLAWASMGLATLTKGPIGVVLPLASVTAALAFLRAGRRLGDLFRPDGGLVFAAVVLPWTLLMEHRNPGYLRDFLIGQNWARFTSGEAFSRQQPWWFYLPVLLGTLLPWSLLILPASGRFLRILRGAPSQGPPGAGASPRNARFLTLLLASVVVPVVILSAAHSKLVYYILPTAPPLAMLVALALAPTPAAGDPLRPGRAGGLPRVAGGICLGCLAAMASTIALVLAGALLFTEGHLEGLLASLSSRIPLTLHEDWIHALAGIAPTALVATVVVAAAAAAAAWLCWRGRPQRAGFVLGGGLLILLAAVPHLIERYAPCRVFPAPGVAALVRDHARPGESVVFYRQYLRGVPFLLQEPVILWEASFGEFGHEVTEEEARGKALQREEAGLDRLLAAGGGSLLVLAEDAAWASVLRQHFPGMTEILGRAAPSYELLRVRANP